MKQPKKIQRVINFSGGKTSALMTILLKPTEDDVVLFTDTGREHEKTYKFINDFEANEGIKVHRAVHTHHRAPGLEGFAALLGWKKYLPNRMKRICTDELKIKTAKRYLRSIGIQSFESYVGFRADEPNRVLKYRKYYKKVKPVFPLYEQGITKDMVNQYWLTKPYTLEIPSILGNCDLCFLKGKDVIIRILQHHPEFAEKWIADEQKARGAGHKTATYFKDTTYAELLRIANSQRTLFDAEKLEEMTPAFDCACTNH